MKARQNTNTKSHRPKPTAPPYYAPNKNDSSARQRIKNVSSDLHHNNSKRNTHVLKQAQPIKKIHQLKPIRFDPHCEECNSLPIDWTKDLKEDLDNIKLGVVRDEFPKCRLKACVMGLMKDSSKLKFIHKILMSAQRETANVMGPSERFNVIWDTGASISI